jgi:hypothetical protein
MPRITVERKPGGYTDRVRKYKVLVDGDEIGRVGAGEATSAEVSPGTHEVVLTLDWGRSPPVTVELREGQEEAKLFCEPNANPITGLYYITLGRKKYIRLHQG